MRLTLRTLLAYMDGILEPADAEEIGKKIEENPQASALLRRARDVMRRLRLKAPELNERSAGLDPNTVSEYLDNVLPDDRVPDFERVCLDSDMHLAEVASCHEILSLVLGEPAEVDAASREHMYQLPQVVREQAAMAAEVDADAPSGPSPPPPRRPKPVVPDYLREKPVRSRRGGRRLLVTLAVLVLIACGTVAILAVSGQLDRWGLKWPAWIAQGQGDGVPTEPDAGVGPVEPEPEPAPPGTPGTEPEPPSTPVVPPPSPEPPVSAPPANPAAEPPVAEPPTAPPGVIQPWPGAAEPIAPVAPATPGPEAPAVPPAEPATIPSTNPPSNPPVNPPAEPPVAVPGEGTPAPAQPEAVAPQGIGRFVSENQVLLRFDPETKTWARVPAQAILTARQELLALPAFRPLVALNSGLAFHLLGGARIALEPADKEGVPGVHVVAGRLVARTLGGAENRFLLLAGDYRGTVTLAEPESTLAVLVERPLVEGANPETEPVAQTV
ncbi:MAG: hypothetical protein JW818_20340, partial [Pirellulales bacterium]|nr:hypothetical protein [Pirellulales bacterium]